MSDQPSTPVENVPATSDTPAVNVTPAPVPDSNTDSYTLAPTWQQTENDLRAEIARLQAELDADTAKDAADADAAAQSTPVADDGAAVFKAEGPAADGSAVDVPAAQASTVPLPDAGSQATADTPAQQAVTPSSDVAVSGDVSNAPNDVTELVRDIHRMVTDIHNLVGDLGPTVAKVSQDVSKNGVGGILSALLRGGL